MSRRLQCPGCGGTGHVLLAATTVKGPQCPVCLGERWLAVEEDPGGETVILPVRGLVVAPYAEYGAATV